MTQTTMCPVCKDTFVDPHKLMCGHSICLHCINELFALQILQKKTHNEPPSAILKQERKERLEKEVLAAEKIRKENEEVEQKKPETEDVDAEMKESNGTENKDSEDVVVEDETVANGDQKKVEEEKPHIEVAKDEEPVAKGELAKEEEKELPKGELIYIRCATCDQTTPIPITKMPEEVLEVDAELKQKVELLKKTPCGHECGKDASNDCTTCRISLCDGCWDNVHKGGMARHQKFPLRSLESFKTCERHGDQMLDLFCKDCGELVCFKCASYGAQHKDHSSCAVEDYAEQLTRLHLKPNLESLKLKAKRFANAISNVTERQQQLNEAHVKIDDMITGEFDKLINYAQVCKNELLQLSIRVKETKNGELQSQLESLQILSGSIEHATSHIAVFLGDREPTTNATLRAFKLVDVQRRYEYVNKNFNEKDIQLQPVSNVQYDPKLDVSHIIRHITSLGEYILDTSDEQKKTKPTIADKLKSTLNVKSIVEDSQEFDEEPASATYNADDEHKTPMPLAKTRGRKSKTPTSKVFEVPKKDKKTTKKSGTTRSNGPATKRKASTIEFDDDEDDKEEDDEIQTTPVIKKRRSSAHTNSPISVDEESE